MRITGGRFGGRVLIPPVDDRIRPTSDKVRQAIFNVLRHSSLDGFCLENASVVDLFAGTGALALEAISHGARYALFVEEDAGSRALIRQNVEALGLTGATKIWRRDATDLGPMPAGAGGPFEIAFLDPPYRKNLLMPALVGLREREWLKEGAILVAEAEKDFTADFSECFSLLDDRTYGETRVLYLRLTK